MLKRDLVKKVSFLQDASQELVQDLCLEMRAEVATPGDIIVRAGEIGRHVYFIGRGTVEVTTPDGATVLASLSDSDFFGELTLLHRGVRTATVQAISYCDLYVLDDEAFDRTLSRYPEFEEHIRQVAEQRPVLPDTSGVDGPARSAWVLHVLCVAPSPYRRGGLIMRVPTQRLFFVVSLVLLAGPVSSQEAGPTGPNPYDIISGWPTSFAGAGFAWGGNSGVYAESPDRIIVLQRGETRLPDPMPDGFEGFVGSIGINALSGQGRTWQNCIYVVDGDGNILEVWDQWDYLFAGTEGPGPHRIRVSPYDPERRIWVIHETGHQIFVFSNDGKELLMTLGEKNVPGQDETHFGLPQDVAFLPDGRILIADGYENGRVMVMDADAKYLTEFGERGEGLGQFNVVHGIAVGPDGRIFVVDRDNLRVQVFSQTNGGSYHPEFAPVEEWTGFGMPLDIMISGDRVWVTDLRPAKIVQLDLDGNRQYSFNLPTEGPFRYLEMHSFAVDSDGNLYGADNQNARIQKFVPKAGIDRSLLVGPGYARR